jgi:hypothetical protein
VRKLAAPTVARLTKNGWCEKIKECPQIFAGVPPRCGPVAQLGARFHGMEEVVGSIPTRSTKFFSVTKPNRTW